MISLNATTKSLEIKLAGAVATTELPFVVSYVDISQSTFAMTASTEADGATTGGTAVTAVAAPGATTTRKLNYFSVVNVDTAAVTLTVQVNNNSTLRITKKITLAVGDQLSFTDVSDWKVHDLNGNQKTIGAPAAAGTLTGTVLASNVVTSSLTTVGALNAGSITSGFGAIDVGADAISGGAGNFSGLLTATGFGNHSFVGAGPGAGGAQILTLSNTTSGTTGRAYLNVNAGTTDFYFQVLSQGYTTANDLVQAGVALEATGAGGLSIATVHASGTIRMYTGTAPTLRTTLGTTGLWQWHAYGAGALSTDASGNITASDGRFKERVRTYTHGLAAIQKLRPVAYHWNKKSGWDRRHEYVSFIAQEVRKAIPGSVPGGVQRGKRMNFDDRAVLAAMVNAIQELGTRTAKLERRKAA